MSKLVLSVAGLALGLLLVRADPAFAERRVALVIGNSAYQNAPALPRPGRDAQAMAAMFQKAGFDVVSAVSDVGILQFKQAIAQFEDEAGRSDIAVVYYAGYGIDIQGINYLIPVDAKLARERDAATEAMTLDALAKAVDRAKRLRLVILDASRDDPFAPTARQPHAAAPQAANNGLSEPEPKPGTLIAYAAAAGSNAEDGEAEHSTYTTALLRNLFTPGLDVRLAFGRVLVAVLKKTSKRQNPLVYGSLGGGNIAVVPAPHERPSVDLEGEKIDYGVVEQIGTARAYEVFLVQHPTGFYSSVAREQLRVAKAQPPKPSPIPAPTPLPGPSADEQAWDRIKDSADEAELRAFIQQYPASALADAARQKLEKLAALDRTPPDLTRPGKPPEVNSTEQIFSVQRELTRLGCFSGRVDGSLDAATKVAIRLYERSRRENTTGGAEITDDFVAELENQNARVCPLTCPTGKIAEGEQCVDVGKSKAIAHHKDEDERAKPDKRQRARQDERPTPAPRITQQQPSGGTKHSGVPVGVGF